MLWVIICVYIVYVSRIIICMLLNGYVHVCGVCMCTSACSCEFMRVRLRGIANQTCYERFRVMPVMDPIQYRVVGSAMGNQGNIESTPRGGVNRCTANLMNNNAELKN